MNKLFLKFLTQIFRVFQVKSLTIYQFTLILLIFTASLSVLIESGLWAYTETVHVRRNIQELKVNTLNQQKEQLKAEVHRVIEYIEFRKKDTISKPISEIKNEVLDYFKDIRFGDDGYVFINTYDGFALLFDGQKLDFEKDVSGLTDPNGIQLFKKELELSKLPDGGFFQYYFKKIYDTTPKPKLSYARGFDEWGWIIGAGDYLDNTEKEIGLLEKELKNDLFQNFLIVIGVLVAVLSLLILFASLVAKSIQNQFNQLVLFLKNSQSNKQATPLYEGIFIRELKTIGYEIVQAEKLAKQFGDIINQSNNEIYIFGQDDLRFVHVNKGAMLNCGYSLDELQKKTPLFLMSELSMESFVAIVDPLKQKQSEQIRFETIQQRKDRTFYPVEVHLTLSYFKEKAVFIAFIYDITTRKEAEQELYEATKIINRSPVVAFSWKNDENWTVEFVSENIKNLSGYGTEEFIKGKIAYSKIIHKNDLQRVTQEVATNGEKKGTQSFIHQPYRIITKNKQIKWVEDITFIKRDPQGNITHYEGIVSDITQRKQTEEQLKQYRENLEELVKERTQELENKNKALERINKLFVGRELRMAELKKEIKKLKGNSE